MFKKKFNHTTYLAFRNTIKNNSNLHSVELSELKDKKNSIIYKIGSVIYDKDNTNPIIIITYLPNNNLMMIFLYKEKALIFSYENFEKSEIINNVVINYTELYNINKTEDLYKEILGLKTVTNEGIIILPDLEKINIKEFIKIFDYFSVRKFTKDYLTYLLNVPFKGQLDFYNKTSFFIKQYREILYFKNNLMDLIKE